MNIAGRAALIAKLRTEIKQAAATAEKPYRWKKPKGAKMPAIRSEFDRGHKLMVDGMRDAIDEANTPKILRPLRRLTKKKPPTAGANRIDSNGVEVSPSGFSRLYSSPQSNRGATLGAPKPKPGPMYGRLRKQSAAKRARAKVTW